jgi:hypothetical protein
MGPYFIRQYLTVGMENCRVMQRHSDEIPDCKQTREGFGLNYEAYVQLNTAVCSDV